MAISCVVSERRLAAGGGKAARHDGGGQGRQPQMRYLSPERAGKHIYSRQAVFLPAAHGRMACADAHRGHGLNRCCGHRQEQATRHTTRAGRQAVQRRSVRNET
ncbi:protein of unknown function [Paraburkholderia kururiensis]